MDSRFGVLVGAGVSIPAGAPSTGDITQAVLEPVGNFIRATDGRFYPALPGHEHLHPHGVPSVEAVQRLAKLLAAHTDSYYARRSTPKGCFVRTANYEDIGYLAAQISDCLTFEYDNPAIVTFADSVAKRLDLTELRLRECADELVLLAHDVVFHKLVGLKATDAHLRPLLNLISRRGFVPILSLNHDTLIEQAASRARLDLSDCLTDCRFGRQLSFCESPDLPTLYKLHGCVTWKRWRSAGPRELPSWTGVLDPAFAHDWNAIESRDLFLLGRFNKELQYSRAPFAKMHSVARAALERIEVLAVSGYSFGDKAVNTMVIEWLDAADARRICVFAQNEDALARGARGAIGRNWEAWKAAGKLKVVSSYLGDSSREALEAAILG